jgi:hypothetical protein
MTRIDALLVPALDHRSHLWLPCFHRALNCDYHLFILGSLSFAALAQDNRLDVYRSLVQAGAEGMRSIGFGADES